MASILCLQKEKNKSLATALLLEYALKKEGINSFKIRYEKKGKPYLEGEDVYFNISHSGDYVVCAVCDKEVGIDIQKIEKNKDFLKLARRFFTKEEALEIESVDEERRPEVFTTLWSIKESYVKYTGIGLSQGMNSFFIDTMQQVIWNEEKSEKCNYQLFEIEHYKIAVCVKEGEIGNPQKVELQ